MDTASFFRLFGLAAIWGGAFLFTRISAPVLGPTILLEARVALAALFLAVVALLLGRRLDVRANWKHYLILGMFNAALPFFLIAFAAQTLSASLLTVMNATAPIWAAAISVVWLRRLPDGRTVAGLLLGVIGVATVVGLDHVGGGPGVGLALAAALFAPSSFGIAAHYAKSAKAVDGFASAQGSMWAASLLVAPALPFATLTAAPGTGIMLAVAALGILCTGVAFLLYFRLVRDIGPTGTLTVTFLIPVFGMLWGHLFLGEVIGPGMILGCCVIILGTVLSTGFNPGTMLRALLRNNA